MKKNIIEFVRSLNWKPSLTPVQTVLLKALYGIPLDTTTKFDLRVDPEGNTQSVTEAEYLAMLYEQGRSSIITVRQGHRPKVAFLATGRRSGKSVLSAVIAAYDLYEMSCLGGSPQEHYGVHIANPVHVMLFSFCREQSDLLLRELTSVMNRSGDLSNIERDLTPRLYSTFRIGGGEVHVTAKSARVTSVRGVSCKTVLLDEMAYYQEGGEIYWAVLPSIAMYKDGGRLVAWSTPKWGSDFNQMFTDAIESNTTKLAMRIPTWEMAPFVTTDIFQEAKKRDPLKFAVEFGAEFLDTTPAKCPHCGK